MIFDLEPHEPLPEGWTPLEAVAVVKCFDDEGRVALVLAGTDGLSNWEQVGMFTAALDTSRQALQDSFIVDEDGEDE